MLGAQEEVSPPCGGLPGGPLAGVARTDAAISPRSSKLPPGAIKGLLESMDTDLVGDPMPIRKILQRLALHAKAKAEAGSARDRTRLPASGVGGKAPVP
jgi:hypothetical protein